tara:strand:+ start:299 stop:772 length:474 start_codon:yes stop_codon:yes gene_type:complete
MNIFVLDLDPKVCAEYHCDKHVVKMILETAQMMCTTLNELGYETPYKPVHSKHPCTLWMKRSLGNYRWAMELVKYLNREYKLRYNKETNHRSYDVIQQLPVPNPDDIPNGGITPFAQAMPDEYKNNDPVVAYRKYYINDKRKFATWKLATPIWWGVR